MASVLIGSPVRQKPQILSEFLKGLAEADTEGVSVSYYFVDDNTDAASSSLLYSFAKRHSCLIRSGSELMETHRRDSYAAGEDTHAWDLTAIEKIAAFKDDIITCAIKKEVDYLLFVDSDIVIDRRMIRHLISRDVEIVSNVFWTQWQPNWELEPQCFWIPAPETQTKRPFSNPMTAEEARQLRKDFFTKMRVPGLYQVDGLGACTLIKRTALEKGVRFRAIPNLSMMGEDRHFCIRAGALDIPLYFDTVYPAYHIYREAYLDRVEEYRRDGFKFDMCQTTAAPTVHQRPERFLQKLLRGMKRGFFAAGRRMKRLLRKRTPSLTFSRSLGDQRLAVLLYVNDIRLKYLEQTLEAIKALCICCLVFDGTTKGLPKTDLEAFPLDQLRILRPDGAASMRCGLAFRHLWEEASRERPDWVLALFSGEIPEFSVAAVMKYLLCNQFADVYYMKRYDMWDEEHYREDPAWELHKSFCPYFMRYRIDYPFHWSTDGSLSVKLPYEAKQLRHAKLDLKLQSFRWMEKSDRLAGYCGEEDDITDNELCQFRKDSLNADNPTLKNYSTLPKAFEL